MKRFLSILFCLLLLFVPFSGLSVFAAPTVGAYDLFVSPDGDDAAAGTLTAPLKTPAAAKEKLKALRGTLSENERATVWLRGGRYEFSETLEFTKDDLPNMTFAAWNEEARAKRNKDARAKSAAVANRTSNQIEERHWAIWSITSRKFGSTITD